MSSKRWGGVYQCGTKRLRKKRKEAIVSAKAKIMLIRQKEEKGSFSTGSDESIERFELVN